MSYESTPTLYEKYGAAIDRVVSLFYQKVLDDKDLQPFFLGVNMDRQKKHMSAFITYALGGPNNYNGKNMEAAHRKLKITDHHFDAVSKHLSDSLEQFSVEDSDRMIILSTIERLREAIVGV
ncbi:hemoglobin [Sulfobacillus thermosulfidooxidans DSM 9293]|uniref:Group 1 truncated hemoglobin n=1 Tax=Sulfobacillus thermosulfidooxidans (strain DSM 9293 / VKM B-1269 / AT-1) TaxID=929705 RepID=A0A1W1WGC6_SULTA|nr:group 1 truncated hemoglobin [Sulfobacillus thermosulfidooxidans]SMC04773.1 hemoglobin [Sulfobacillus thermosulfidooxidans DSM 9293]